MSTSSPIPSPAGMLLRMVVAVLLGAPLVAYLWETLHQVLSLHVEMGRLLRSVGVLFLFAGLLWLVGRDYRSASDDGSASEGGTR